MTSTMIHVSDIAPINRDTDADRLAGEVYERLGDLLRGLTAAQWDAPTDCPPWTVADMVRHMVGAAKGHVSLRESVRQMRHGKRHAEAFGGSDLDAMNQLQVDDHAYLHPPELLAAIDQLGPKAVRKRMKQPALVRRVNLSNMVCGNMPPGSPET